MKAYRLLLLLYPKSFRHEYGEELCRVFARRRREAGGRTSSFGLWVSEIADTCVSAARVHIDILRQDARHTWRGFTRAPGFFVAAVAVTALGIGATTAVFTLGDHVLIRPLPFPEPDRLVKIWEGTSDRPAHFRGLQATNDVSPANYRDWKTMTTSFSAMGTYFAGVANLVGAGDPERLSGFSGAPDALTAIGVAPAFGRPLVAADDAPGAPCVVLLSDTFWRRKFGPDRSVLGRSIRLDDETCAVVGVMPAGFEFPARETAFWRAIRLDSEAYGDRDDHYLRVIARLKSAVSLDRARADLAAVSATLEQRYPRENRRVAAVAIGLREEISAQSRVLLIALTAAAVCVLLIACTNLASLFLARATAHARELAVRTALGAGRDRLIRQLMTESFLIAAAGGTLGVLLAIVSVPLAASLVPTALPIAEAPSVDLRMMSIAAALTIASGFACGVFPALRGSRTADAASLRSRTRAGVSRRTERLRSGLVIAQVTASVALLVCAGLLLRALWQVQNTDVGFRADRVLTMRINLPWSTYALQANRAQFYRRVVEDIEALPGVARAGFTSYLPLTMRGGVWGVNVPGRPQEPGTSAQGALSRFVTPGYFDAMGIPLKSGRSFDDRDTLKGEPTAIVSETFGRKLWPGEPFLGKRFILNDVERTIVGIVGEVKVRGLERQSEPQMYLPAGQQPDNNYINYAPRDLAVRADGRGPESGALAASIRQIVSRADPQLPISDVQPLSAIVEADTEARAAQAHVLVAFAVVACVLAGVGLHGLLAFVVSARTAEIGVRCALGAQRHDILLMVVGRGVQLAAIGSVAGLALAYLAGRSVRTLLAGIDPADPMTLSVAAALACVMTLAGSLLPALRAMRIEPIVATKSE